MKFEVGDIVFLNTNWFEETTKHYNGVKMGEQRDHEGGSIVKSLMGRTREGKTTPVATIRSVRTMTTNDYPLSALRPQFKYGEKMNAC